MLVTINREIMNNEFRLVVAWGGYIEVSFCFSFRFDVLIVRDEAGFLHPQDVLILQM